MFSKIKNSLSDHQAKATVWNWIEELDGSIKIKDLYSALLDPVAMNRVANKHLKVADILLAHFHTQISLPICPMLRGLHYEKMLSLSLSFIPVVNVY